jgi:hypothetical protein
MEDRMASFTEKYEFEDEFTEQLHMTDMMQFVLAAKVLTLPLCLMPPSLSHSIHTLAFPALPAARKAVHSCAHIYAQPTEKCLLHARFVAGIWRFGAESCSCTTQAAMPSRRVSECERERMKGREEERTGE